MANKIVTAIIDHDMDFLIHFQRNVIKNCSVEGIDPRVLSAMRDKFYYAMWNWIRRYWRNIGKAKDIAPQTAAAYERALDKQVEEVADLKYRLSSLTQWRDIQADPKWGFATDDAIDEIFRNLPRLVRDKRDGCIELIDYDNAAEWRGDLERKPSLYQWLPINGNTL